MKRSLFALLLFSTMTAAYPIAPKNCNRYRANGYEQNRFSSREQKNKLRPYLLPIDHPLKKKLDAIFYKSRASQDEATLRAAGFNILYRGQRSGIIVASHPTLPNVLIKLYLDATTHRKHKEASWVWLWRRCVGAQKLRQVIQKRGIRHFAVPDKWIYPLPLNPRPQRGHHFERKNEVLVVTNMQLVSLEESIEAWATVITEEHLDEFYEVITEAGGGSYRADNVAYTQKGQFAFIDTEYPYKSPNYQKIVPYLSPAMRSYWVSLLERRR